MDTQAEEAPLIVDWQGHAAMHLTWKFFAKGLTDKTPKLRWKHQFKQVVYEPYLAESGVRIFLTAAIAAEKARNPEQARRMIVREFAFIEDFVASHSDRYAMAKTPAEARSILATTDKMVIVHSIEGGHLLLSGPEDAQFWRDQGVALVTVLHLRDDELGGAAMLPMRVGKLINRQGAKHLRKGDRRGLTERGAAALVELDDAGILVDLSHMSPETVDDALRITSAHAISPVVTHGQLTSIRDVEQGYTDAQIGEIYRQGGVFSLGISGVNLDPIDPSVSVPESVCPGTLEMFRFHYEAVLGVARATDPEAAVGWSSDWNGWVSHSKPAYGKKGCRPISELSDPMEIDTRGLAHPGLLPEHWARLQAQGMDLAPMLRSGERFLELWEDAQAGANPTP